MTIAGPSAPLSRKVTRHGLAALFGSLDDMEVVAVVADGREAVKEVVLHKPDVALLDLKMPHLDGFAALREISRLVPATALCVLTMYDDDDSLFAAMKAGARATCSMARSRRTSRGRCGPSAPEKQSSVRVWRRGYSGS